MCRTYGIGDLLHGFDVVAWDELVVGVEELDTRLLERTLGEKQSLDTRQALVRVVIRLFNERQLLTLRLVEAALDRVCLLQLLEREDEELRVMLIVEGPVRVIVVSKKMGEARSRNDLRERNRREFAALEPMDRCSVDCDSLLSADVRAVLEVTVLALLLGLEVQTSETTKVLLNDGLVDGRTTPDTLTVVMRDGRPPVGLALDVPQDDVLDRGRHAGHLPGDVRFPATPRLGKVLEDRLRLVLLDRLGHHVEDVVHDGGAELEVVVRLHTLLGHGLRNTLAVTTLELTCEQVPKPVCAKVSSFL